MYYVQMKNILNELVIHMIYMILKGWLLSYSLKDKQNRQWREYSSDFFLDDACQYIF
jgi:SNF family Na+-dependent transporter